jgi:hypothetical protein
MTWVAVGVGGAAVVGAGAGYLGAKSSNKKLPNYQAREYSGLRPPRIDYTDAAGVKHENLRPVQQMITDTLMRRSQGQDVGYDPERMKDLQGSYDIDWKRQNEETQQNLKNRLSGSGQSRNIAAQTALLDKAQNWANDTRSKYQMELAAEDLGQRNIEKREATGALQNLNQQNFGQENTAANFDLSVYGAENQDRATALGADQFNFSNYKDPLASGLNSGVQAGTAAYSMMGSGGASAPAAAVPQNDGMSAGMNAEMSDYLKQKSKMSPTGSYGNYRLLNA